jgi:hypothetical protein
MQYVEREQMRKETLKKNFVGKRSLARPRRVWEVNIKINLKGTVYESVLYYSGAEWRHLDKHPSNSTPV